jgi:hypothetical protein
VWVKGFGDMSARFVLSVGSQTDIQYLGAIPPNFIVWQFVPQLEVLRHASVCITLGGIDVSDGTVTHDIEIGNGARRPSGARKVTSLAPNAAALSVVLASCRRGVDEI